MDLFSIFKSGKYFDKHIDPKCDYCRFGKRAKDGNKVLCEKRGLVDANYSCGKFLYSPLKRIPVKQLNFVGSLADEDLYIESKGDRAEKEEEIKKTEEEEKKSAAAKKPEAPAEKPADEKKEEAPAEKPVLEKQEAAPADEKKEEAPAEAPADEKKDEAPAEDTSAQ